MSRPLVLITSIAASAVVASALILPAFQASAHTQELRTVLRDPSGTVVGRVTFSIGKHGMTVRARLLPNQHVVAGTFHGLHVHANNIPTNGDGCLANPAQPSSTWFASVDGHLADVGETHGHHSGDLPSPLVLADGTATMSFTTDRIDPAELIGRAVILHYGPDNFGNVPVGTAPDQYLPNAPAATDKTSKTGNAGDRLACGLVVEDN